MLKNILVPLDGSALSESALPYAEALAKRTGASLTLVRAAHHPAKPRGNSDIDTPRAITEAEAYLDSFSNQLAGQGFVVQRGVPFGGSAAAWIVEEIDLRHADLIVMATHDRVGPDRWVHGSVAEAVVNRATVPVMLVRETQGQSVAQRLSESQPVLIVPLDGSDLAEAALPLARELAGAMGARLLVLGVIPRPGQLVAAEGGLGTFVGAEYADVAADAQAYLEAVAGRLGTAGSAVETSVRQGDPATEIAWAAEEVSAAAVIMATHGRTGPVRSIVGSVAGGVLHRSAAPVVLVHPGKPRPSEQPVRQPVAAAVA